MRKVGAAPAPCLSASPREAACARASRSAGASGATALLARRVMPRERRRAKPSTSSRASGLHPPISASSSLVPVRGRGPRAAVLFLLREAIDRKSTRLNSSHVAISYAVLCLQENRAGPCAVTGG